MKILATRKLLAVLVTTSAHKTWMLCSLEQMHLAEVPSIVWSAEWLH